jgi:hypothetical protein
MVYQEDGFSTKLKHIAGWWKHKAFVCQQSCVDQVKKKYFSFCLVGWLVSWLVGESVSCLVGLRSSRM